MKFFALTFLVLLFSCNSANKSVTSNSENEVNMNSEKMVTSGFIMGTISASKEEGDCPFTIKIDNKEGSYFLDPINLTEEYQEDGKRIWFKFTGLRRMNRCDKASPINITEIEIRS